MPHDAHLRPMFEIRAGLFLYDHLAKRKRLPASRAINLHRHPAGSGLNARFRKGFIYSDAWTDDARLVVLNARDAAEHGATVLTRTRCEHAERRGEDWLVTLVPTTGGSRATTVRARTLVNAAGPWVADFPPRAHHREFAPGGAIDQGQSHRSAANLSASLCIHIPKP